MPGRGVPAARIDMVEAVQAMKIGDLLRWTCGEDEFEAFGRCVKHNVDEFRFWLHWHGGHIWIVRYE